MPADHHDHSIIEIFSSSSAPQSPSSPSSGVLPLALRLLTRNSDSELDSPEGILREGTHAPGRRDPEGSHGLKRGPDRGSGRKQPRSISKSISPALPRSRPRAQTRRESQTIIETTNTDKNHENIGHDDDDDDDDDDEIAILSSSPFVRHEGGVAPLRKTRRSPRSTVPSPSRVGRRSPCRSRSSTRNDRRHNDYHANDDQELHMPLLPSPPKQARGRMMIPDSMEIVEISDGDDDGTSQNNCQGQNDGAENHRIHATIHEGTHLPRNTATAKTMTATRVVELDHGHGHAHPSSMSIIEMFSSPPPKTTAHANKRKTNDSLTSSLELRIGAEKRSRQRSAPASSPDRFVFRSLAPHASSSSPRSFADDCEGGNALEQSNAMESHLQRLEELKKLYGRSGVSDSAVEKEKVIKKTTVTTQKRTTMRKKSVGEMDEGDEGEDHSGRGRRESGKGKTAVKANASKKEKEERKKSYDSDCEDEIRVLPSSSQQFHWKDDVQDEDIVPISEGAPLVIELTEKERAKAAKEAERSYAKVFKEANRLRTSKTDTVREIRARISPDLEIGGSPLFAALTALREKFDENGSSIESSASASAGTTPGLITFERNTISAYDPLKKSFIPLPPSQQGWKTESAALIIVKAAIIADQIMSSPHGQCDSLSDWYSDLKARISISHPEVNQIFLIISDLKGYYSKQTRQTNKEFTARARAAMEGKEVPVDALPENPKIARGVANPEREEIERQLLRLQMKEKCFLVQVNTKSEMEDWIWNLAADLAIRPYKLIQNSHLPFAVRDGAIGRKGKNPIDTFQLMLGEMEGITPSGAEGITRKYPTFRKLMEAYDRVESEQRESGRGGSGGSQAMMEGLVADCQVRNLKTGHETRRPLGKAVSRHVYATMRGTDPRAST